MEFLLFLCAALSALTGAITGGRAPGVEVQIERVSAQVRVVRPAAARVVSAIVEAQRLPALGALRRIVVPRPFALTGARPVRGERRRE